MEVIKASNLFEWLKQVKVILKQPINDIIKVLKVDEKYPDYVSFNLLVSALDDLPANTYMETHLFCKVTDNKQFRTERNFFRQDLKAQARV